MGGYLGDAAAKWSANHGRILVCQASVLLGVPFSFLVFKVYSEKKAKLIVETTGGSNVNMLHKIFALCVAQTAVPCTLLP
jgi:hypothetical protein